MSQVYNKCKQVTEPATKEKCPRCSGFGSVFQDDGNCTLCLGYGKLWKSITGSGWTRALYRRLDDSQLY